MGVIEDIKTALSTAAEVSDRYDKFNVRSVARSAHEQSFIFPALIDRAIPIEYAQVITKNLDRVYASWTQIYLSSIGFIDLNYIKNPRQFIAKYQPKYRLESADSEEEFDCDDCSEELKDQLYGDNQYCFLKQSEDLDIAAIIHPSSSMALSLRKQVKEGLKPHLDGINQNGIPVCCPVSPKMEAGEDELVNGLLDNTIRNSELKRNRESLISTRDGRGPKLSDTDVKKLNDMQPYALELRLLASKGDSSFSQWINYVIGVKTNLHPADTNALIKNIVYVLQNKNPMFNFIRWTTGEISLFKDIILHLDDINFDVANKTDRTGKFIASLKKMKKKYLKVGTFGVNRIAPYATIVIASSTYQEIKEGYGYDIKNLTFAHKIMEELFLMCLVIVDDVTHTVDMLVDGQQDFQTYALETLEREVTMNSNKLGKELTRMLGSN